MSWTNYLGGIDDEIDLLTDEVSVDSDVQGLNEPLYQDAIALGSSAAKVYLFLWKAAGMDHCRKIYNTNNWTIKGIANELGVKRETVSRAVDKLLDDGLLRVCGKTA
jgi:DNA-binding MarR family transcriptional regulator